MYRTRDGRAGRGIAILGLLLASCSEAPETNRYDFPQLGLSAELLEFGELALGDSASATVLLTNDGELPLGITAIELGDDDRSTTDYALSWSLDDLDCPAEQIDGAVAVLAEGCSLPVLLSFTPTERGELWGSLVVHTGNGFLTESEPSVPTFFADPLHGRAVVLLSGEGTGGDGNILVSPRSVDFGHLWPGDTERAYVGLWNDGEAALTLMEPTLQDCDDGYSISDLGFDGAFDTLEPGYSTYIELTHEPETSGASTCTLSISSDDPDTPQVQVELEASTGVHGDNHPPTAVIHTPGVGTQYSDGEAGSLELLLSIFDLDQPADTLDCQVRSMVLAEGATVADCQASDASGSVTVQVPYESVGSGTDTLRVRVEDGSDVLAFASISVLWHTALPTEDDDGDGWGSDPDEHGNVDCDDTDAATYPYAAEQADGQDNDCDGVIDEGTSAYDDDGDGFSEDEGDCNDQLAEAFPGAWESPDQLDNDCDGDIDEDTSLSDDDGDTFSEMEHDCDDTDPAVHPAATEYCDGIDNDCNGLRDYSDDCIELSTEPLIAGGLQLGQTACEPGDSFLAWIHAHDADGQALEYSWSVEEGLSVAPLTGSSSVTVSCPTPSDPGGSILSLTATVSDEDDNSEWATAELWVYPSGALHRQYTTRTATETGCSSAGTIPALSVAWLALLAVGVRRRREG